MMEPRARVNFDARLQLPNHALFVGASQSGKTTLCLHLLSNPQLFHPRPCRILFCYDQLQDSYLDFKNRLALMGIEVLLYKGFSDLTLDSIEKLPGQTILLIDDFSEDTASSSEIARIATNGRHKNLSLWLIWHSLFSKYAASRVVSQNLRWYFFLPSLRLESQLRILGSQLGLRNRLIGAFKDVQERSDADFRYVLLDCGPVTPDVFRVRTGIENSDLHYCYLEG